MTAIKTAASAFALALPLAAGMALAGAAHAAGFYLQDLSAKQAGNAYSGAATAQAFMFGQSHCDRVVAAVLTRIA